MESKWVRGMAAVSLALVCPLLVVWFYLIGSFLLHLYPVSPRLFHTTFFLATPATLLMAFVTLALGRAALRGGGGWRAGLPLALRVPRVAVGVLLGFYAFGLGEAFLFDVEPYPGAISDGLFLLFFLGTPAVLLAAALALLSIFAPVSAQRPRVRDGTSGA